MQKNLTRAIIFSILAIIIGIYYYTELIPFQYENFEKDINRLQRYDAELDSAVVQTKFGIIKHYDPINKALYNTRQVIEDFQENLNQNPNANIQAKLDKLQATFQTKYLLVQDFIRINPVLLNALFQFSSTMAEIIESESHLELIESCFEQEYQYQLIDKVNTLFRGVLIYVNVPSEDKREKLSALVTEIRNQPEKFDNLDRALTYADKVLDLQPKLDYISSSLYDIPILTVTNELNASFNAAFDEYLENNDAYRIILYALAFLLLVVVSWAFNRLQKTISALHIEIEKTLRAERALAKINAELEQRVADRTKELSIKNKDLNQALGDLKDAQEQLIIQEKMASVGMLTTGIAHEIKNPLNFVNNFSEITVDLVDELQEELADEKENIPKETADIILEIIEDLKTNCNKIREHGQRADNIVKTMLIHSEQSGTSKDEIDITQLLENNINITVQNFKEKNPDFEIEVIKEFAKDLPKISVAPQAIGRAFMYIIDNALYAVHEKAKTNIKDYKPEIKISVSQENKFLIIKFWDNGTGIEQTKLDKVFEPFYTTKPTGMGNTGLGLSICYDTIVKQHKGELIAKSQLGDFTQFLVKLPLEKPKSQ